MLSGRPEADRRERAPSLALVKFLGTSPPDISFFPKLVGADGLEPPTLSV